MDPQTLAIKLNQAKQDLDFMEKKLEMTDDPEQMDRWEKLIDLKKKDIKRLKSKQVNK